MLSISKFIETILNKNIYLLVRKMTSELKNLYKKSKKSFSNLDKNQDGFISMSEIDAYMKKMNIKWAEAETEKYMKEVDLDDDGKYILT